MIVVVVRVDVDLHTEVKFVGQADVVLLQVVPDAVLVVVVLLEEVKDADLKAVLLLEDHLVVDLVDVVLQEVTKDVAQVVVDLLTLVSLQDVVLKDVPVVPQSFLMEAAEASPSAAAVVEVVV